MLARRPGLRSLVVALAAAGVLLGGCSGRATAIQTGRITGDAPICYGPGPNANLQPVITIRAVTAFGQQYAVRVKTSEAHHRYRMTLPAGAYTVEAYSGSVHAVVRRGATTGGVNLPQPGCI